MEGTLSSGPAVGNTNVMASDSSMQWFSLCSLVLSGLVSVSALADMAPLNCSNIARVVPDAEISYSESKSYLKYDISYDRDGAYWLGAVFEFHPPFSDNYLLKGVDASSASSLTEHIAENYKTLLVESGAHASIGETVEVQGSGPDISAFTPIDKNSIGIYSFYARTSGSSIQVFRLSGVKDEQAPPFSNAQVSDEMLNLIAGCKHATH